MIQIYEINKDSGRQYLISPDRFNHELQKLIWLGISNQQHDSELKRYQKARYYDELVKAKKLLEAAS
jgi:hypothetical protein